MIKLNLLRKGEKEEDTIEGKTTSPELRTAIKFETKSASKIDKNGIEDIEIIPIKRPYSYVRIIYNHNNNEYSYNVVEPKLTEDEKKSLDFIEDSLIKTLDYELEEIGEESVEKYLKESIDEIIDDYSLDIDEKLKNKLFYYVCRDFIGFGKIDIFMKDLQLEDISCDGPGVPIFLFHRKYESIRTNVIFDTEEELDSYVIKLVQRSGKHISVANPIVDATLMDGSRLQATLSQEVTPRGSSFTIRKFREDPLTPPDLVASNTMSPEMAAYLWLAVQYGESMICSGGTASGKTSTLNATCLFIPPSMKIVSIEDTRELNLPHENWIAGLTRGGFGNNNNGNAIGEIDMYELMRAALRQRPQYMIVGEVRGKETYTLFQAMATGHTTYSTMHADSAQSIVHRLESPPINLPRILLSALDIVILQGQVRLQDNMVRRVKEIIEFVGIEPHTNEITTNSVFVWTPNGDRFKFTGHSALFDKIAIRKNKTRKEIIEEWERRTEIISWMQKTNTRSYLDVAKIISSYYKEPEKTLNHLRRDLNNFN